jgi:hypothetical protein
MPNSTNWASQQLMEEANRRMVQQPIRKNQRDKTNDEEIAESAIVDVSSLSPISLFEPPLYLSEKILLVADLPVGGGRGYIAKEFIPPGTLVMVEEPMITYPEAQLGKALSLVSVEHIVSHPKAQDMLHDLEYLYPTKQQVDHVEQDDNFKIQVTDMMEELSQQQHQEDELLPKLVQLAQERHLTNRDTSLLTARDMIRLLLVLRYNGLETGVYKHVAMLNHSDCPNCVKFLPNDSSSSYSEVRTTRPVPVGKTLTISYLPRIVSHASRRWHLWEQHRFDIGADIVGNAKRKSMEAIGNHLPLSSLEPYHKSRTDSITSRIETATQELEEQYHEAAAAAIFADDGSTTNVADQVIWDTVKALELAASELYTEAKHQLRNDNHVLLIPCLRLHLDLCDLVQRAGLTVGQRIQLLLRLVVSARHLVALQEAFYGKDHFELARTHLELAQALEEVLSRSPKDLLQLDSMTSFAACSSLECSSRKEYERISSLYPKDAKSYISKR